jgi:simple sugar transport system ATP-binding protein
MKQENRQTVLSMKGITKRFPGVVANDHIDLNLFAGEVLALLGENGAGKSSLMNVLAGLYRPDEGDIIVRGERVSIHNPQDSMRLGIGMIHQEFMLVETMTVAENIILGLKNLPLVPHMQEVREQIKSLSKRYGLQVDPDRYMYELSVGEQQRVEILKLVYRGADILILDEPTAVLTPQESRELNQILKIMLSEGKSAIFITHKMDEVLTFSDRVQVLRQGKTVAECSTSGTTPRELASMMVGREVLFRLEKTPIQPGDDKLILRGVTVHDISGRLLLDRIDLTVREGEIMGVAGVAGNGQQELAEAITGLLPVSSGEIRLEQMDMTNKQPIQMIRAGMSHIPADRGAMGVVGDMSVSDNLVMKRYRRYPMTGRSGIMHASRILRFAKEMITSFVISTPGPETQVKFLSGGNIQKTILAREIDSCGGVLIAVYPSRGLDVGATEAVRRNILMQRENNAAVLLISEELDELLSIADRIAVMNGGRIMGIVDARDVTKEELGLMMAGVAGGEA